MDKEIKMKFITVLLAILLFQPLSASAGVKDKKIKNEADSTIQAGVDKVKTACGNQQLSAKIDWANWDKLPKSDKTTLMESSKNGVIPEIFDFIEKTCKGDKLYKEEIEKLTEINISGKEDKDEMYAAFVLDGTVLDVKVNLDGYGSWKNEELLKEVWE
jgi:hypothetical protein